MSAQMPDSRNASGFFGLLAWLVTILVPAALVLTSVRVLFSPPFVGFEYGAPGFPADPYGFSRQDRQRWTMVALDYLYNDAGIEFLGDLRFEDGTPVYNERELGHMVDVKRVFQGALLVWYGSLAALVLLGVWARFGGWWEYYRQGLARGGWLTVFLLGTIVVLVLIAFSGFFVAFHEVFFPPGTWVFFTSDTLIRLFPERLWRDFFLFGGVLSAVGGLLLARIFRK